MTHRSLFLIFCFVLFPNISLTQISSEDTTIYTWSDAIIGQQNTGLFNGLSYVEKHKMINEKHKFFQDFNFVKGFLVYDDEPYDNVLMKYDIFEDQLILKYSFSPSEPGVLVDASKLKRFKINNHDFENLKIETSDGKSMSGFFESLYESNSVRLLKKYQKRVKSKTNDNIRYHEFEDDHVYLVYLDKEYVIIKNPKKIVKQFSKQKRIIKEIPKMDKNDESPDYDSYLIDVFKAIANSKTDES